MARCRYGGDDGRRDDRVQRRKSALLDGGYGRRERVDGEPRLGAQVARRLGPDTGREAFLVGNGALEHQPLRFTEVERVPPAELERDLVGRIRVDHQVDAGGPTRRRSHCRSSRDGSVHGRLVGDLSAWRGDET